MKDANSDIAKYETMLLKDAAIIELRTDVLKASTSQLQNGTVSLSTSINAIDGAAAGIESGYVNQIIQSYNKEIRPNFINTAKEETSPIIIESIPWIIRLLWCLVS